MSNRFYFGDDDSSNSSADNLPYPKPLTRASFLTPDFDPTTFLSTLRNRHQTLEDLRTELRTRSQELNKELLDVVSENYQDFLSLGSSLKGGDEKVEEVRLGLLGFRREVEGLKGKLDARQTEVEALVEERKKIRAQVQLGRQLLEVERKVGELESRLMLASSGIRRAEQNGDEEMSDSDEESDEDEEGEGSGVAIAKLRRHVEQYLQIRQRMKKIGTEHPFLVKLEERMLRLEQTVLLDMNTALKLALASGEEERKNLLEILDLYGDMGHADDAIKLLKEAKKQQS